MTCFWRISLVRSRSFPSQAGLDTVKWVNGDDCSATGIIGDIEDAEGLSTFDLLYYDAAGFTAQMIAFPEEEVGGPYAMCCESAVFLNVKANCQTFSCAPIDARSEACGRVVIDVHR